MSLPLLADADLVARCRLGDQEAWAELVERFSRYVYAIATRVYGLDQHAAEDVFQEVFTRTYERLGELRDDAAVRPWIATLTRRLCVDTMRAAGREQPEEEIVDPRSVEEGIAELDEAMTVHEALKSLPEHCEDVLDRFFSRDESYRTIGDALGLPPGTIASRISRCLGRLRRYFEGRKPRFPPSRER
jgi:RNA polymerase sigma factor (sigma-70 family)